MATHRLLALIGLFVTALLSSLVWSATAEAQVTWDRPADESKKVRCPAGLQISSETAGRCCWPGQVWGGGRCVGKPTKCPKGQRADADLQACVDSSCEPGMVVAHKRICCWPGQVYSRKQKQCVGRPTCPPNHRVSDDRLACELIPPDADQDGIVDAKDKCPKTPEDVDGFEDEDGCPDLDNDADGLPDAGDRCPMVAEDIDSFEDLDGCPDIDNDNDNIADTDDQCPVEAEDVDGFQDQDGCPELDNDADGIADKVDQCPLEPEDNNGFKDDDGCPDEAAAGLVARRWIGYGTTAAGVLVMGAGGWLYLEAEGLRDDVLNPTVDPQTGVVTSVTQAGAKTKQEDANALATYSAGTLAVGAILTGVGAWLVWTSGEDEAPKASSADGVSLQPEVLPDFSGARLQATWAWE